MIEVESKEDLESILAKTTDVLVLFYARWCGYCQRFLSVFETQTADFKVAKLRVILDDYNNQLWDDYEVKVVPTVIYFKNGKVMQRLDGRWGLGLSKHEFDVWLKTL